MRAFARLAPVEGRRFSFVDRIPRERGLGSSAAVIALGLVAAAAVEGLDASTEELLAEGVALEGHADNLARGTVRRRLPDLGRQVARVADDAPAVPIVLVPDATVSTASARAALPTEVAHDDATFTAARAALLGAALASGSADLFAEALARPAARALPRGRRPAARSHPRGRLPRAALGVDALRLRPERRRLGATRVGARVRRRSSSRASPTSPS